jgi:fluoride exporter
METGMTLVLLVGSGGFLGSVLRYLISTFISRSSSGNLPYSTIIINLVGSFIVGVALTLLNTKSNPAYFYFLIPGFLGGFTTYSAFSAEAVGLIGRQLYIPALIYIFLSLSGGLILCALGMFATKTFLNQI